MVCTDGRYLAVGAQDNNIHLYEILDDGQVFRRYEGGLLKVSIEGVVLNIGTAAFNIF